MKLVWLVYPTVDEVSAALCGLTALARVQLDAAERAGAPVPALYASGVRYQREPGTEVWMGPRDVLRRGYGDCEDLAAWRAAELQRQGIQARAICYAPRPLLIHCVVQLPDGRREDPSRALGMGGEG